jgi:tRNA-dihydrouridine synthase B
MKIGKLNIEKGILLAPMEGVTDLPFRVICRKLGADIVYSEFIASEGLIRDAARSLQKLRIHDEERPVAIQIVGDKIESMVESAKIVEDSGADILDINFGCWVKKVVNNNAGAAFLKNPEKMAEMTGAIVDSVSIPVTAKTRLGWEANSIVIIEVAKLLEKAGAKALTVHCRTREMGYKGEADWSWIPKIKSEVQMPIILNGDVKTPEDVKKAFDETGCDAVMIGRAAYGNPFLFGRSKEYLLTSIIPPEPTIDERISTALEHLRVSIQYKGFPRGLFEFRKHHSGYLKGLYNASSVRQKLVIAESYEEVERILNDYKIYLSGTTIIEEKNNIE